VKAVPTRLSSRPMRPVMMSLTLRPSDLAQASRIAESTICRLEGLDGPLGGRLATTEKLIATLGTRRHRLCR